MKFIGYFILSGFLLFAIVGIASSPVKECDIQKGYGCLEQFESVTHGEAIDCSKQSGTACLGRRPPQAECDPDTGDNCEALY